MSLDSTTIRSSIRSIFHDGTFLESNRKYISAAKRSLDMTNVGSSIRAIFQDETFLESNRKYILAAERSLDCNNLPSSVVSLFQDASFLESNRKYISDQSLDVTNISSSILSLFKDASFIESNRKYLSRAERRAEQYDDTCGQPVMDNFPKNKYSNCMSRADVLVDHSSNEDTIDRCSDQIDHHQLVNSVSSSCEVSSKVSSSDESAPYNPLLMHKSESRLKSSSSRSGTSKRKRLSFYTSEVVEHNDMVTSDDNSERKKPSPAKKNNRNRVNMRKMSLERNESYRSQ